MRKIVELRQNFDPSNIDRKILNEILEILNHISEHVEVVFFDDEYEYSSLAEVDAAPGARIARINITTRQPFSYLELGKQWTNKFLRWDNNRLFVREGGNAELLFFKTREALLKRERVLSRFFSWWIFLASIALNLCIAYAPVRLSLIAHLGNRSPVAAICIITAYQFVYLYFRWRGMTQITLGPPQRESFWHRNRDDLRKLAIGAVVGALMAEIVRLLVSHFGR